MPALPESLDLSSFKRKKQDSWLDRHLKDVTNGDVGKEMVIGGVTGW